MHDIKWVLFGCSLLVLKSFLSLIILHLKIKFQCTFGRMLHNVKLVHFTVPAGELSCDLIGPNPCLEDLCTRSREQAFKETVSQDFFAPVFSSISSFWSSIIRDVLGLF